LVLVGIVFAVRNPHFLAAGPAHHAGLPLEESAAAAGGPAAAADHEFTLQTGIVDGHMVFLGVGGALDGRVNPDLIVKAGGSVRVTLVNGDGMAHDLAIPDLGVKTPMVSAQGATVQNTFTVTPDQVGAYDYFCTVSGHRQAGMAGKLIIQ
jgi:nitrite reductase (NO-forming)